MIDKELDEIIFKDREKGYGAFYLRRYHRWILLFSLWLSIVLVCIPLAILYFQNLSSHDLSEIKSVTLEEFNHLDSLEFMPPPQMLQVELKADAKRFKVTDSIVAQDPKKATLIDSTKTAADTTQIGNENGAKKNSDSFYVFVEQMPEFPGGQEAFNDYVTKKMDLSSYLKTRQLSGTVTISFTVNKLGAVADVKIVNSLDAVVDNSILSLFQTMPNWKPAMTEGKPIKVQFVMPINVSCN